MATIRDIMGNDQQLATTSAVTHNTLALATSLTVASGTPITNFVTGTFTPTVFGSTSAGTATYTKQQGTYRRINNIIEIDMAINWTAISSMTGNLRIGGLPFTSNSTNDNILVTFWGGEGNALASGAGIIPGVSITASVAYAQAIIYNQTSGGASLFSVASAGSISFSGRYYI